MTRLSDVERIRNALLGLEGDPDVGDVASRQLTSAKATSNKITAMINKANNVGLAKPKRVDAIKDMGDIVRSFSMDTLEGY